MNMTRKKCLKEKNDDINKEQNFHAFEAAYMLTSAHSLKIEPKMANNIARKIKIQKKIRELFD